MDVKEACLKVWLVPVCLLFLIILTTSFVSWLITPTAVEASRSVIIPICNSGDNALVDATQTTDIAVNGNVIYVTIKGIFGSPLDSHDRILIKSINGGMTWTDLTYSLPEAIVNTDYIAVAPDDPNIVVVTDKTSFSASLSINGGITWLSLGLENVNPPLTVINDVAVSPMVGGVRYVAVAGVAGGTGTIYYFSFGSATPSWQNAVSAPLWAPPLQLPDAFWAVKFSPNFTADLAMLAVSSEETQGVKLNVASFNTHNWNSAVVVSWPRKLSISAVPVSFTITSVDISLDPNFFLGDESAQIGFVSASITDNFGNEIGGVSRIGTYTSTNGTFIMTQLITGAINSVAWNGTVLVIGSYNSNYIYSSTDPLGASPHFITTAGGNAPGGEKNTLVAFSGADVIAATSDSGSGISRSTDGAITFQMILPYHLDGPTLVYPPNNATGIVQRPTFSWQAVPYTALYRFELASDTNFIDMIYTADLSQTAFKLPVNLNLQLSTTYYWRVKSRSGIISSSWSSPYVFTVNAPEITIHPASGVAGSNVTIEGTGCMPNTAAIVWFDSNNNTAYDNDELSMSFTTSSDGSFPLGISLTVPSLSAGNYQILADVPIGGTVEASVEFAVTEPPKAPWWPIAVGVGAVSGAAAIIATRTSAKKWSNRKNMKETKAKLQKAGVEVKVINIMGKLEIKSDTPLQAGKALSLRLVQDVGTQSIEVKGPFILDVKEVK